MNRGFFARLWRPLSPKASARKPMRQGLKLRALCALEELESRCVLHANPVMDAEHAAVFALVPDSAATNVAIHSGRWDDAATWDGQLERDNSSGKLAELAKKSLSDHKSGKSTEL